MPKFNVGDRVVCIAKYGSGVSVGETGTIVGANSWLALVEWDDFKKGRHDCGGLCEYGRGWNVPHDRIELASFDTDLGELPVLDILSLL